MSDQTNITNGLIIDIPVTQTPEEIYDAIMVSIEPELTSTQLPLIAEKYKDETAEEKQMRGMRYQKAFQAYEVKFSEYQGALQAAARNFQVHAMKSVEKDDRIKEESELSTIESTLSVAD
jgi:hypothetical protein